MFRFLNNLSIRTRLLLGVTLFLATLFAAMFRAYVSMGANVEFAAMEIKGNKYQRPVSAMLYQMVNLRAQVAAAKSGIAVPKDNISSLIKGITQSLTDLKKIQSEIGEDLQFTPEGLKKRGKENLAFSAIESEWYDLALKFDGTVNEIADEDLSAFIGKLRGLIAYSGDASNLILDPDLDSYYLMDVTLLALPQTLDRQGGIAQLLYAAGEESENKNTEILVISRLLKESDVDRVAADIDTYHKEDANFYGQSENYENLIEPAFNKYLADNNKLYETLSDFSKGSDVSVQSIRDDWIASHKSAYNLLTVSYDELDSLLGKRIESYRWQQTQLIMESLLGIVVSLLFYLYIARTLESPLKDLNDVMRKISNGELDSAVPYTDSRSEIGAMATSIDVFKQGLFQKKSLEMSHAEAARRAASIREEQQKHQEIINQKVKSNLLNVQQIAIAMEQMVASINEIVRQSGQNTGMISTAQDAATKSLKKISQLKGLSDEIDGVVALIREISSKTNLLALNATIEAARAGEAGRGFSVVAEQVKGLASQTTAATQSISSQVQMIQKESAEGLESINEIHASFSTVNSITNSISAAVEQQRAASEEISRSTNHIATLSSELIDDMENIRAIA